MNTVRKLDHMPLLSPGRHSLTLAYIKKLCVDDFGENHVRRRLYQKLEGLVQELLVEKILSRIWLDGSFLTHKIYPSDIDIVIELNSHVQQSLTSIQKELMLRIDAQEYYPDLDAYVLITYPQEHGSFWHGEDVRQQISSAFSIENSGDWLKGIAMLDLGVAYV